MTELPTVTKRQMDVLVNCHLGDTNRDQKRSRDRWHDDPDDLVIHPWGRPERYGYSSNCGGAVGRMHRAMEEKGLFAKQWNGTDKSTGRPRWGTYDRFHYKSGTLSSLGLKVLKDKWPDMPDLDEAIAEQEAHEASMKADEERWREEDKQERKAKAATTAEQKPKLMGEILQSFQVRHDLSHGQLRDMFDEVLQAYHHKLP